MSITPERNIEINHLAWEYWRWHAAQESDWTRNYLVGRGLRGVQAGRAPDGWARLVPTLRKKGVGEAELEEAGLARRSASGSLGDAFRDRLVLPIKAQDDRIIGFTARRNPVNDPAPGEDGPPKYLNTITTPVFEKSRVLYGLDAAAVRRLADGASPALVEGALDVEATKRAGPDYVPLATLGTAITPAHLELLRDINPTAVEALVSAMDPDEGGLKATTRLWEMLTPREAGEARTAVMSADPADMIKFRRAPELRAALDNAAPMSHAVVDHKLTSYRLDEIEGYVAAARSITGDLSHLDPHQLSRAALHLADRIGTQHLDLVIAETISAVRGRPATPESSPPPASETVAEVISIRSMNGFDTRPSPVRPPSSNEVGTGPPAPQTSLGNTSPKAPDLER